MSDFHRNVKLAAYLMFANICGSLKRSAAEKVKRNLRKRNSFVSFNFRKKVEQNIGKERSALSNGMMKSNHSTRCLF